MARNKRLILEKFTSQDTAIVNNFYYNYIKNVLRMKPGNHVILLDGKGKKWKGILEKIDKKQIIVKVSEAQEKDENATYICCAYSIPKGDKHEFLVEKLTEIGIKEIIPVKFQYSINYTFNYQSNKYTRMKKIIKNALCQSGNCVEPILYEQIDVPQLLQISPTFKHKIYGKPGNEISLKDIVEQIPAGEKILYVIGPEGGFTEAEEKMLKENGFIPVCISPYTLKIETAAILLGGIIQLLQQAKYQISS